MLLLNGRHCEGRTTEQNKDYATHSCSLSCTLPQAAVNYELFRLCWMIVLCTGYLLRQHRIKIVDFLYSLFVCFTYSRCRHNNNIFNLNWCTYYANWFAYSEASGWVFCWLIIFTFILTEFASITNMHVLHWECIWTFLRVRWSTVWSMDVIAFIWVWVRQTALENIMKQHESICCSCVYYVVVVIYLFYSTHSMRTYLQAEICFLEKVDGVLGMMEGFSPQITAIAHVVHPNENTHCNKQKHFDVLSDKWPLEIRRCFLHSQF